MKHRSRVASVLVGAIALTGCGGGGGGYGGGSSSANQMSSASLSSAPAGAALVTYLRTDHDTMLQAMSAMSGMSGYNLQVRNVPNAGTTTFNGAAPAYSAMVTLLPTKNGQPLSGSTFISYYLLNPYVPLGRVAFSGSPYGVVTSSTPLANMVTVGDSGAVDSLTYYHDSTMTTMDANETDTYSVMANNSATLLLCLNSTISDVTAQGTTDGMANGSTSDCYTVDAAGNATLASHTMMLNGMMITFD